MTERKFFGFIDSRIGLGSVIVFAGQIVIGAVYAVQDHQTIKELGVKLDRIAFDLPLQNRDISEHGRRLANIDGVLNNLSVRVGNIEQVNAGLSADLRNISDRIAGKR